MTEEEWLACEDPGPMLDSLAGRARAEKLRVFAFACHSRVSRLLVKERTRSGIEEALQAVLYGLPGAPRRVAETAARVRLAAANDTDAARRAAPGEEIQAARAAWAAALAAGSAERKAQADLVRCLFGLILFRPLPRLDPAWLVWEGGTIPNIARSAYEERAFDRLPVLADALEEAGCDAAELLAHLRGPGPHARGCWALDLLLGKH